jgi:hypothetical protein
MSIAGCKERPIAHLAVLDMSVLIDVPYVELVMYRTAVPPPGIAVGFEGDVGALAQEVAKERHARPGIVSGAAHVEQLFGVCCGVDHNGGVTQHCKGVDVAVDLAPFGQQAGEWHFGGHDLDRVADEGKPMLGWAGRQRQLRLLQLPVTKPHCHGDRQERDDGKHGCVVVLVKPERGELCGKAENRGVMNEKPVMIS